MLISYRYFVRGKVLYNHINTSWRPISIHLDGRTEGDAILFYFLKSLNIPFLHTYYSDVSVVEKITHLPLAVYFTLFFSCNKASSYHPCIPRNVFFFESLTTCSPNVYKNCIGDVGLPAEESAAVAANHLHV